MWNLRNTTDEHMGKGRKNKRKTEREANHVRLLSAENTLKIDGGEINSKKLKEGTCWDEHWVLHGSDESLNSTPEAIITLYVN